MDFSTSLIPNGGKSAPFVIRHKTVGLVTGQNSLNQVKVEEEDKSHYNILHIGNECTTIINILNSVKQCSYLVEQS